MPGSVCRHLKIAGRVPISRFFHVTASHPKSCNTSPKDGIAAAAEPNCLPDDGRVTVEPPLPVLIAQNRYRLRSAFWRIVGGQEGAPQHGWHAKKRKGISRKKDDIRIQRDIEGGVGQILLIHFDNALNRPSRAEPAYLFTVDMRGLFDVQLVTEVEFDDPLSIPIRKGMD